MVKEEIRLNVLNRPYGGFPWMQLPPVLFDTFANAHNGYGDFVDLEQATVADAADFFDTLLRAGQRGAHGRRRLRRRTQALALVERALRRRPGPARAGPPVVRRAARRTPSGARSTPTALAPLPALAVGWRLPDPVADLAGYLPYVVLGRGADRRRGVPAAAAAGAADRLVTDVSAGTSG